MRYINVGVQTNFNMVCTNLFRGIVKKNTPFYKREAVLEKGFCHIFVVSIHTKHKQKKNNYVKLIKYVTQSLVRSKSLNFNIQYTAN